MAEGKELTPLGLLRDAGASIKCNTFRAQLAFNMIVDATLYLEGVVPGYYYNPDRFASQLLGGEDDAPKGETVPVGGIWNLNQQEDRKTE